MAHKVFNVYSVGNAIVDILLQISESEFRFLGYSRGGMELVNVDDQNKLLTLFQDREYTKVSGGSAANSMIACAQLGAKIAFGCSVGADDWGRYYCQEMEELGINCFASSHQDKPTGTCVVLITPDAERTMRTNLGASLEFGPEHVSFETLSRSEYLYIEGYLLAATRGQEAAFVAAEQARKLGVKIALSVSADFIASTCRTQLQELIVGAELIIANAGEAITFTGAKDEDSAFNALKGLVPITVMTLRERGARICYHGKEYFVPSPVVHAIDETGAGDVFAGAFLYGLCHGLPAEDSARLACLMASRVVTTVGPRLQGNVKVMLAEQGFQLA